MEMKYLIKNFSQLGYCLAGLADVILFFIVPSFWVVCLVGYERVKMGIVLRYARKILRSQIKMFDFLCCVEIVKELTEIVTVVHP